MKGLVITFAVLVVGCSGSAAGQDVGSGTSDQKGSGLLGSGGQKSSSSSSGGIGGGGLGGTSSSGGMSSGGAPSGGTSSGSSGAQQCIQTGNATCDACLNAGCCTPIAACSNDAACTGLYQCLSQCAEGDTSCSDGCLSQYGSGKAKLQSVLSCVDQTCAGKC